MAKSENSKKNAAIEAITIRALNDFGDLHMSVSGEGKVGFVIEGDENDDVMTIFNSVFTGENCIANGSNFGDALTKGMEVLGKISVAMLDGMNPEWDVSQEQWDEFLAGITENMTQVIAESNFEKEYVEQYLVGNDSVPIVTIVFKPVANAKVKEVIKEMKKK